MDVCCEVALFWVAWRPGTADDRVETCFGGEPIGSGDGYWGWRKIRKKGNFQFFLLEQLGICNSAINWGRQVWGAGRENHVFHFGNAESEMPV